MLELKIDGDFIHQTKLFLTNQKLQLVINGHNNREKNVKIGIPQGLPISPILFLIYISKIFDQVKGKFSNMVSLSFIDDLGFIESRASVKKIAQTIEKVCNLPANETE